MDRRSFLVGAATTVAGLSTLRAGENEQVFPIVDTHQHLWDLKKFRLNWLKKGAALDRSYLPADYAAATADLGTFPGDRERVPGRIAKTVYMEVDVVPEQQVAEADYVIDLCRRADNPMVAAVVSGRPASEGFAKYVDRFKDSDYIKGIRQVLHVESTPAGYCLAPEFVRGIQLLGERGLRFDLCMRPGELGDAVKLIDACPDTRFVLDHCGNGDVQARDRTAWKKGIAEVAKRKNVVGKVSGIVASAKPGHWSADDLAPIINHTLEVFGPERVMFGGDWPVCTTTATYKQWVEALKSIVQERSVAEQRRLFHDNAVRFYELE